MPDGDLGHCPDCATTLVRKGTGPPWCPGCEWNLAQLGEIDGWLVPGEKRRLRRSHARAFAQNRALYDEFARRLPQPPGWTGAKVLLAGVSIALLLFDVALAVLGVVLIATTQFILGFLGVVLLLIAIELRPRLNSGGRRHGELSRKQAPALYALVDDLGDRLGAPRVDRIVVDDSFNASCGRVGLRFRPVLTIGVALWTALTPAGRVALLGHELGHLVNGDPGQGLLTQPALNTFARLAYFFHPRGFPGPLVVRALAGVLLAPLWFVSVVLQLSLWRVASRDHVRAELHADVCGLTLAGTSGADELATTLVLDSDIRTALERAARRDGTGESLLEAALSVHERLADSLRTYEQLSLRTEASLFATHPPAGMRLRLVRAWPRQEPATEFDAARQSAVEAELADGHRDTVRALSLRR